MFINQDLRSKVKENFLLSSLYYNLSVLQDHANIIGKNDKHKMSVSIQLNLRMKL